MFKKETFDSVSRVGIFVDVQYLFFSAKKLYNTKIDYKKMLNLLSNGRDIAVSIAYLMFKEGEDVKSFELALKHSGYDIKRKNTVFRKKNNGQEQNISSWDVGIAVDMIRWAPKVDTIVLVSGSGVFVEALEFIKNNGCRIEVSAFRKSLSRDLEKISTDFIDLAPVEDEEGQNSENVFMDSQESFIKDGVIE